MAFPEAPKPQPVILPDGQNRNAVTIGNRLWVVPLSLEEFLALQKFEWTEKRVFTYGDQDYPATLCFPPLARFVPFNIDIRLMRLDELDLHEDWDANNFARVQADPTSGWLDRPLFAANNPFGKSGKPVLLDGVTRFAYLSAKHGLNLLAPVQVVNNPLDELELDTWLTPPEIYRLSIPKVLQMATRDERVLPRQTRFGINIGDFVVSAAETQPHITFYQPLPLLNP